MMTGLEPATITSANNLGRVAEKAGRCYVTLLRSLHDKNSQHFQERGLEILTRLHQLQLQSLTRQEIDICLLGSSRVGKSTLINALLQAHLLPISTIRACTSAVTEVGYANQDGYEITVEFVSRESWQQEIGWYLSQLRVSDPQEGLPSIPQNVRDKIRAIFHPERALDLKTVDLSELQEPPFITKALQEKKQVVYIEDLKGAAAFIEQFLTSNASYWPIVKSVKIRGPFEALACGIRLVDLPGLNDPNQAREEVTRRYLKDAHFVWIIFEIKNALTKDLMLLMHSDDFFRHLVVTGKTGSLAFIGTMSDDVDPEIGKREFLLSLSATGIEVVEARNQAARQEIREQLRELAIQLAERGEESQDTGDALAEKLLSSPIFTLSALEYLRLQKLLDTPPQILKEEIQTEVPALLKYIQLLGRMYGNQALAGELEQQLELVLATIEQMAQGVHIREQLYDVPSDHWDPIVRDCGRELVKNIEQAQIHFQTALLSSPELLRERLKRAIARCREEREQSLYLWNAVHPATLRAVVRHGGVFTSANGSRYDFVSDLTKPLLDSIAFTWSDFFGERLHHLIESKGNILSQYLQSYRQELLAKTAEILAAHNGLQENLANHLETTQKSIRYQLEKIQKQMARQIEHQQTVLFELISQHIRQHLQPAFSEAAQQKGAGTRERIMEILKEHVHHVTEGSLLEIEEQIQNHLSNMIDWLNGQYAAMSDLARLGAEEMAMVLGYSSE